MRGATNDRPTNGGPAEAVISIIGPGMKVVGDCVTDGTIRVEGRVEGSIKAGKAVVVGKEGTVDGNIDTQDAVISGTVSGTVSADSRLELQATCHIDGEIFARRMQLEEGAILNGRVHMGDVKKRAEMAGAKPASASLNGPNAKESSDVKDDKAAKDGASRLPKTPTPA